MSKFIILVIILILFIILPKSPTRADTLIHEQCYVMGQLAEAIMRDRQSGQSPTEIMNTHVAVQDPAFQEEARDLVFAAFEETLFSSSGSQRKTIIDFRNDVELECYENFRSFVENG